MNDVQSISSIERLRAESRRLTSPDLVRWAFHLWGDRIAIASSFGVEDVTLIHLAASQGIDPHVFFLDTGRLHGETYELVDRISKRYGIKVRAYNPDHSDLEKLTSQKGHQSFYESIEDRKECCNIRKTKPLQRALSGLDAWMTGLRKEQSSGRAELDTVEWDVTNQLVKVNPLANWTLDQLWDFVKAEKIPYNPLHDRGFPSIGCAPCTRAIGPGEPIRAGRWWWEEASLKECGLHGGGRR